VQAQSPFKSKKEEKLYEKLDDAYYNYDYGSLLDLEDDARTAFFEGGDTLAARVLSMYGEVYDYELGDLEAAYDLYNEALELRRELTPDAVDPDLISNVATLSYEVGKVKEAESLYLELIALDLAAYGEKDSTYQVSEITLLDFYSLSQQPQKGLEKTRALRRVFDRNSVFEAIRLKSEGDFYEMQNNFSRAERSYARALKLFRDLEMYESVEYVGALNSLATLYTNLGQLPKAEELYLECLDILESLEEVEDIEASINSNLAQLNFELGNYEEAKRIYDQLIEIDREYYGEESAVYAISLYAVGLNQLYAGAYADARDYFERAEAAFRVSVDEDNHYFGDILNNLCILNTQTGNIEQAQEQGNAAIEAFIRAYGEDHEQTAFPHFNLGNAFMSVDEHERATELHERALEIRRKALGKNHPYYALSTRQLAILEWKKGNREEALSYFEETFENYFKQINLFFPILTEEEKAKFYYNKLKPTIEQFNAFVIKEWPEDELLLGRMYDYQLILKGIILSATTKARQGILDSGDSTLMGMYDSWLAQKEQLARLFSDTQLPADVRASRIDSLQESSDLLETSLSKASTSFAKAIDDRQPTWQDIRDVLKPGEASVEIVRFRDFSTDSAGYFTDEVYYAALTLRHDTRDHPEMVLLRNGQNLETNFLANYRNGIKYQISESVSYDLFWKPIKNKLEGIKKLYFSPDGVYNQISIYTLQNPENGEFVLEELDVRLVNNTRDIITFEDIEENGDASIFFGYPNYNLGVVEQEELESLGTGEERGSRGGRGGRGGGSSEELDLTQISIPRGLRGNMLRYMRSNSLLVLLPGTKKEVELIDSLYQNRDLHREVYLENQAIEEEIKSVEKPKSLHIATHGFFLEDPGDADGDTDAYVQNPLLRSGLILAGANSFIRAGEIGAQGMDLQEDGILTAYEAMNMDLEGTDLVVLSACETGLGEIKNGEGVFGLQRAFQVAGAEAIIMSMWTVDDAATQELMTIFYEEWLESGDKHQAFNKAQKRLKDKWKKPYYWGAFVMVGN
jgi:CHAT domain-containing protein